LSKAVADNLMTANDFLEKATRILFFTGKGGVGKTSLACATAIVLSSRGRKVLLVSTDPASNLDEVLGAQLSSDATLIPGTRSLFALNIDPEAAAAAYRERVVGPYRGVLPAAAIASMEEQLSGACTVEIAAFDQFTRILGDPEAIADYDHVIFDTAPTGHTIRLLTLPGAWTGFIATNTTGTSCLGQLSSLESRREVYESSLRALSDSSTTTLVLVSRPEASALAEADRTRSELESIGMANQVLIINGSYRAWDRSDPAATALENRSQRALSAIPERLASQPSFTVPLFSRPLMGVSSLASVFTNSASHPPPDHASPSSKARPSLSDLIDQIEQGGPGAVLTMGKGGVGKTTIAAAIAVALADRGHAVHLSTTDPAAHLQNTMNGQVDRVRVSRIDPAVEIARYTAEVLEKSAPYLDQLGLAVLKEDLRSPCTEEIAVFRAFAETVGGSHGGFVVLDTAPTGHTLLLLDAAEAYHREVSRTHSGLPEAVRRLLPRLRDPRYTRVILVTSPEPTPVHEAARLQADLNRAGIPVFAWIVNQSFSAGEFSDPFLREYGAREEAFIQEIESCLAERVAVVPWNADEPVGADRLRDLAQPAIERSPAMR
jgi:arsenite-transporting ATPase